MMFRFGTVALRLSIDAMPRLSRSSPVIAMTEIGTSCKFVSRRVAVTTISSNVPGCESAVGIAQMAGVASAAPIAMRIALGFIGPPGEWLVGLFPPPCEV